MFEPGFNINTLHNYLDEFTPRELADEIDTCYAEIERLQGLVESAKPLIEILHRDYMHVVDLDFAAEKWRKDAGDER